MMCAYCRSETARNTDHLITRSQARRSLNAARARNEPKFKVPACFACNVRKATRLYVPMGYEHKAELERVTGAVYREWDGDPKSETFRSVVK